MRAGGSIRGCAGRGRRAARVGGIAFAAEDEAASLFAEEDEADEAKQVPEHAEDERDVLLDVLRDGREADEHNEGPHAHEGDAGVLDVGLGTKETGAATRGVSTGCPPQCNHVSQHLPSTTILNISSITSIAVIKTSRAISGHNWLLYCEDESKQIQAEHNDIVEAEPRRV